MELPSLSPENLPLSIDLNYYLPTAIILLIERHYCDGCGRHSQTSSLDLSIEFTHIRIPNRKIYRNEHSLERHSIPQGLPRNTKHILLHTTNCIFCFKQQQKTPYSFESFSPEQLKSFEERKAARETELLLSARIERLKPALDYERELQRRRAQKQRIKLQPKLEDFI